MSSQPLRPVAMDPLHITEFASDRYFEKLSQQKQQQQQQQQQQQVQGQNSQQPGGNAVAGTSSIPPVPPIPAQYSQSPFILPVGRSKPVEVDESAQAVPEPKHKKSRFGLRSLRLHHKSQQTTTATSTATTAATAPILEIQEPRRSSVGDELVFRPKILPLDALFLALPIELQIQVIASLPLRDILNLRLTSKVWHATVTMNEGPIVRYHLDHHIPAYAKRLYPHDNANLNFHYLCGLWHRLHVAAKLSFFICEWVTKEIFLRTTDAQKLEFAPQKERMRRRLVPLLFTIFHFFETYRARHVQYIRDHHGRGLQQTPYTLNPIELEVMNMYDDRTLLQVHQVFPLVIASFCRRLRPPSYVGRVERSLRGYLREKPADEVHVAALCVGGLRQVERFWEIKGYNTRRGAVDVWYNSVATEPLDPVSKPRRGLMGLGRKKSTVALKEAASAQGDGSTIRRGSVDSHQDGRSGLIFNTSLAAGMPMGTLSRDELRQLMPDLPVLQQLWTVTAEALILDRKIVERSIDIKRNAQVMLELIREEGIEEEDEWWYGQGANDSVRPPLDSIEEDPIEEGP